MNKAFECSFFLDKPQKPPQSPSCNPEEIPEASHDALFVTDENGKFIMAKSAWERIWRIRHDSVLGKRLKTLDQGEGTRASTG